MSKDIKLVHVPFEEAVDGELYITEMKHGWIQGYWDAEDKSCRKYYWRDMEWWPEALYRIVENGDIDNPFAPQEHNADWNKNEGEIP